MYRVPISTCSRFTYELVVAMMKVISLSLRLHFGFKYQHKFVSNDEASLSLSKELHGILYLVSYSILCYFLMDTFMYKFTGTIIPTFFY